ncbi:MAG: hypothetical protein JNK40_05600 [Chromatiales bacterium]|nr:hypothetical protein [Chromatiales bacterium]
MQVAEKVKANIADIEEHTALNDDQKVSRITHIACATCAAVGTQPVPFADIFLLATLQAYFSSRIAALRGVAISESDAMNYVKGISGMVGIGILAEQIAIGLWKLVTFGLGGILTFTLDYALTYAVMKVSDAYFSAKARGEALDREQIRSIWKSAYSEGKRKGVTEKQKMQARKRH